MELISHRSGVSRFAVEVFLKQINGSHNLLICPQLSWYGMTLTEEVGLYNQAIQKLNLNAWRMSVPN